MKSLKSCLQTAVMAFAATTALAAPPTDPAQYIQHVQLGHSYALTGMTDQAIKEFEEALKYSPNDYDLHQRLGTLYGCPKGMDHLKESIRIEPDHWEAYSNLGMCLIQQGKTAEGREMIGKALELNPRNAQLQYQAGQWNMADKNYKAAAGHFEAALKTDPDYFDAADALGTVQGQLGDNETAEKTLRRAIIIMPNHPAPYIHLAPVLKSMGQQATACINVEQGGNLAVDLKSERYMREALTILQADCPKSKAIAKLTSALKP